MPLEAGLAARVSLQVDDGDTALAMHSGEVPVLATPRVIALCEEAACVAVGDRLQPGHTTVGVRVQLDHVAPSPVGELVTAEAVLDRVEGRRLSFTVSVSDEDGLVAAGRITRVVVDKERFLSRAL